MLELNKIHKMDIFEGLKQIPDSSIDCIVTSPPYWALRNYRVKGQLGLENNPQEYIDKIVSIMKECKRILKPTGTIWLNIGDSFYNKSRRSCGIRAKDDSNWLQVKQKLLTPYRIAIKCQDELGLILRNDINWIKQFWNVGTKESYGASMPTSVKDRLNTTSESLFFFVKQQKYFFNLDFIRLPHKTSTLKRARYKSKIKSCHPKGKNPGDCIMFPLEPSREKHIAMFPTSLPEFCVSVGCPKGGVVLDPFMGSGTTAIVAQRLGRKFIGFEINRTYIKIANRRIKDELSDTTTTRI